ncbi:MAG: (d)CMP kinase [Hyphomicrobiales bacterium]
MTADPANLPRTIAIDGPAASGKTTLGRALAERFGYRFLDTGLMYRAFTLAALRAGVAPGDPGACGELAAKLDMRVVIGADTHIFLGDEDVTGELRSPEVEANVSAYSAIPAVRQAMVARQREVASEAMAVLAGRDIGTVVLPDAPLKFYLEASEAARAERRARQSAQWGTQQRPQESHRDITARDAIDSTRKHSPLEPAADAIRIDTTDLTLDEMVERAMGYVTGGDADEPVAQRTKPFDRAATVAKGAGAGVARAGRAVRSRIGWATFVPAFYWFCVHGLRVILWVVGRWTATGREHIPATGGVIVVSNHLNNADPPILASGIMRRRIRFMAKVELFKWPFGIVPRLYGAFPVRRFESDLGAMLNAERMLKRGEVLGMFPEGHRSRTGRMGPLHPGTALIALRAGAPVLPCAIIGTERLKNPLVVLRKPRIEVHIGEPIPVEKVRRPSEAQVSALTQRIGEAIEALLPEAYRHTYTESDGEDPPGN